MKKEFDLLSEDSDSYDFFMLEAILAAGYRPRVIMVEYISNFELTEARSILPPRELHYIYQPFRNPFLNSIYLNSNRICMADFMYIFN